VDGVRPACTRLAAAAAILAALAAVPRVASAWSSTRVGSYTLDMSIESETRVTARLTLDIEVLGGRFRGFKIARADEGLSWSKSSMFCENSSGKKFMLERVPRADGLTDFRFVTPGFIPKGSALCSIEYGLDPVEIGALQLVAGQDPSEGPASEKVRFTYKTPGLPVAIEQFVITIHLPAAIGAAECELGELAAEEYTVESYPSALTLRRYRPPAYYTGLVDLLLPQQALAQDSGTRPSDGLGVFQVDRFVGVRDETPDATRNLWILALVAAIVLALIALKHRATARADALSRVARPYLLLSSSRLAVRLVASGALLVLYVVLSATSMDAGGLMCIAAALVMNLRGGLVLPASGPASGGSWAPSDPSDARRLLGRARLAESAARLFLDATTTPGIALLAAAALAIAALKLHILADRPDAAMHIATAAIAVLPFMFLTSTRLGGYGYLASRSLGRLVAARRAFAAAQARVPGLVVGGGTLPDMRLRMKLATPRGHADGVVEIGVEWTRGWCVWHGLYAVVVRMDARSGALVADAEWLDRAEVHSRIDTGVTAIVVRTRDATMLPTIVERIAGCLPEAASAITAAEAVRMLHDSGKAAGRDATPTT
jgi:hypothetical protein